MRHSASDRPTDAICERSPTKEETHIRVARCEEASSQLTSSVEQRNQRLCLTVSTNDA
jgi:hypothetical protein